MKDPAKAARLKAARKAAGYETASEAAEALGMKGPSYTHHENCTRDYSPASAAKYARKFKVKPEWLLYGKGAGPTGEAGQQTTPEYETRFGIGGGGMENLIDPDQTAADWIIPSSFMRGELRVNPPAAWIIAVHGDSGYNPSAPGAPGSLFPGDRVIIDTSDTRPSPPGPFAVYDGTGLVVKLVEIVPGTEPPLVRFSSRNPAYKPYEATEEEIKIIGRVRGRISAM